MRKWSPEELPAATAADFQPLALPEAVAFAADFGSDRDRDPLAGLTPAQRERARQLLAAEVEAALKARAGESWQRREDELRALGDGLAASLAAETAAVLQGVARAAAELALAVAERIVRREVALDPATLARALEDLLLRLPAGAPLAVTVHPDDAAWLESQPELRQRLRIAQVHPDRRIERGGCRAAVAAEKIGEGGHRVPGEAGPAGMLKAPGEGGAAGGGQLRAVQRHVEHDVGVEECLHRTCLAMIAATRSSLRAAGSSLNAPCQRAKKASLSCFPAAGASRSKCSSTRRESGTPRRRATALARWTDLALTERVSLVFIRRNKLPT